MTDYFDRAVSAVLLYEGGYADDAHDSGGVTKYGISKARYPDLDIANLTIDEAKALYERDFWDQYRCGDLPWPLGFVLFDSVVQFNPANPIKWLQAAVGATPDGQLGVRTLAAANACTDPVTAARRMMTERGEYRTTRPNYGYYGKGWRKRDLMALTDAVRGWGAR